jgi:hypothetical protein
VQPAPHALASPPPGAGRSFRYDARPWRSSDELCTCKDRHACGTRLTARVLRRSPGSPAAPSCSNRPSATDAHLARPLRAVRRARPAPARRGTRRQSGRGPQGDPSDAQSGAVTGHWATCSDPRTAMSANEGADSLNYPGLHFSAASNPSAFANYVRIAVDSQGILLRRDAVKQRTAQSEVHLMARRSPR